MRATVIRRGRALVASVPLLLGGVACAGTADSEAPLPPTTMRVGNTDVYTYQLVCPSPVGDLATSIEFTVTDSLEHVTNGEAVTYLSLIHI